MKEYFKVIIVNDREIDKFLAKGWEIIETEKARDEYGERVTYHIGFSLNKAFEMSLEILRAYEKHDLRNQLLKAEANEIGENLEDYNPHAGKRVDNSLSNLFVKTDFLLTRQADPQIYKNDKDDPFIL